MSTDRREFIRLVGAASVVAGTATAATPATAQYRRCDRGCNGTPAFCDADSKRGVTFARKRRLPDKIEPDDGRRGE